MDLGMNLELEQKQELIMTPRLKMAIELLQYNNQELAEYLTNQLAENPMLDQEEDQEWETRLEDHYDGYPGQKSAGVSGGRGESFESFTAYQPKLLEHLESQLCEVLAEEEMEVGCCIINNLTEEGLLDISLEEIAGQLQQKVSFVQQVLLKIQKLDPAGIASRNVKEALLIQLESLGVETNLAARIITGYWEKIENISLDQLCSELGAEPQDILTALQQIKNLQPRPAEAYHSSQRKTHYLSPDMIIRKHQGQYRVELNNSYQPTIHINPRYYEMLRQNSSDETGEYLQDKFKSALWLIKAIENRRMTLVKIGEVLVQKQREFLEKGIRYLKPLSMREVAEAIEMHESTVSRAVRGKYIQTPCGLFTMKFLFASGVGNVASASIKALIVEYISQEESNSPLSDSSLAALLEKNEGLSISRRTIAKYRRSLNIPSSVQRKKWSPG